MTNKKKHIVDCLGLCNKKFMSVDPKSNRICQKCSEKIKKINNDFGKMAFKQTRETTSD